MSSRAAEPRELTITNSITSTPAVDVAKYRFGHLVFPSTYTGGNVTVYLGVNSTDADAEWVASASVITGTANTAQQMQAHVEGATWLKLVAASGATNDISLLLQ